MRRLIAVSVLRVERPEIWQQLEAVGPVSAHVLRERSDTERVVDAGFLPALGRSLEQAGWPVLVRHPRRAEAEVEAARSDLAQRVGALAPDARRLLWRAQRLALGDEVLGSRVWDPLFHRRHVQSLLGSELIHALPTDLEAPWGPYRLHPDLPPPPAVAYDFEEAVMGITDDLSAPGLSLEALLHDLASLTAALARHAPRRTHAGTLDRSTAKKLGRHLGDELLAAEGRFEAGDRWVRALRALELLGAVSMDPATRVLGLEPGMEDVLAGSTADAMDRLVHRLVDADLHAALPALRASLAQAGDGAVDELIFVEELCEQHRDVLHGPWHRDGVDVYPGGEDTEAIAFDDEGFERIEARQLHALVKLVERLGLVRRADGVFSATDDGRHWATGEAAHRPPVWVSSDLGVTVPPGAITPWERFQLERLGRCVQRDVVDVYRLERAGLVSWLATHDIDEALALLARRCPAVPSTVADTLRDWARSALRVTLTVEVVSDP